MKRLSEEELKLKIESLTEQIKNTADKQERIRLQHSLHHYRHYTARLDVLNQKRAKNRVSKLKEEKVEGHKPRIYSNLDWELAEAKRTAHIKLDTEDFKKYWGK